MSNKGQGTDIGRRPADEAPEEMALRMRRERYGRYGYDIDLERDRVIERALPFGPRVLETGTGKGHFTLALARRGFRVTTIDISAEEQAIARMQLDKAGLGDRVAFLTGDAADTGLPDASFDAVFSVNLLHHLKEPERAMDEMTRLLAPDGKLVMSDFTAEGFRMLDEVFRSEGGSHEVSPFGMAEAERFLLGRGLKVTVQRERFQVVLVASRLT